MYTRVSEPKPLAEPDSEPELVNGRSRSQSWSNINTFNYKYAKKWMHGHKFIYLLELIITLRRSRSCLSFLSLEPESFYISIRSRSQTKSGWLLNPAIYTYIYISINQSIRTSIYMYISFYPFIQPSLRYAWSSSLPSIHVSVRMVTTSWSRIFDGHDYETSSVITYICKPVPGVFFHLHALNAHKNSS